MKNRYVIFLTLLLVLPLQFISASAPRTLVVHSGSACATGDLYFNLPSEALSSAAPGDTVLICPGTYDDNVKVSVNGIKIVGHGDPSEVRIEALNNTQNVIELRNVRNVTLENLTVSGAVGSQMAGVHIQLSSESVIRNIIAVGNYFGINVVSSSNITLAEARAENNTDAGIYLKGATISSLTHSLSRGNRVGILLLFTSDTSIDMINATGNSEGGILMEYSSNNTVSNSFSGFNGWYGVYLENSDSNSLSNITTVNNTALGSDGYGIYAYLKSENNSFRDIDVRDNVYGVAFVSSSDGNRLSNSTIYNSTVADIYVESSSGNDLEANISSSVYGIWIQGGSNNTVEGGEVEGCRWGILISNQSSGNVINGTRIHDNSYIGIVVDGNSSKGNVITRVSTYNNTLLGIDLGGDFVTPNDGALDEGPNDLIDYPVFSWAAVYGSRLIVKGYISTEGEDSPNSNFNGARVEVYQSDGDPSGYGEGFRYLGSLTASDGQFIGWIDMPPDLAGKPINLTATSTLLPHGTSEFGPAYLAPVVFTNLTISKSINPSTVTPNSTAEVLLLVRNYGNGTAYNLTVTDVLPEGMSYVNGTSRVNGDLVEPEIDGRNLSWKVDVPADSEVEIRFNVSINAPGGTTLENLAIFDGDYGSGNDTSEVRVIKPAVIGATKEANPDVVSVNQTVNYTIKLTNSGGMGAFLMVEDVLPPGMTYVAGSFRSNVSVEGPSISGNRMRYNLSLGPGKAALVRYSLKATSDGTKENRVYVNGSFMASSSILVRDPPSSPPPHHGGSGSGGSSGGSSSGGWSSLPPPCGWIPPTGGENGSTNSSIEEEPHHNYKLTHNPIVLVSLGSQGLKITQGSDATSAGPSTSGGNSGIVEVSEPSKSSGLSMIVVEIMATPMSAETGTSITFLVRVSNVGDGPADNLTLLVDLTRGLDYVRGSSMMGGLHREPDNENNELVWKIGHLSQGKAIEVSFRAKLLATSGKFNVVAKAGSSSDSVLISVKPKSRAKQPKRPAPAPEVVDLRASATSLRSTSRIIAKLTSPTGANHVKVIANLNSSLKYVQGSSRVGSISSPPRLAGNTLEWQVSIGKGKSVTIAFEVSPADEDSMGGKVLISLPEYGKRAEVEVEFSPAERAVAPPPSFKIEIPSLPPLPWWLILIPLIVLPFLLAVRRRKDVRRVVMDYEALKWAALRGMLEDFIQEQEIIIPKETFSKVSRDRGLMPWVERFLVDGKIKVEKAPRRKVIVNGADEELSAALGLADREKLPIYIGREDMLRELKRRGFDVRLVREAPPPMLRTDLP